MKSFIDESVKQALDSCDSLTEHRKLIDQVRDTCLPPLTADLSDPDTTIPDQLITQTKLLQKTVDKLTAQLQVSQDQNIKLTEQYNQMKRDSADNEKNARSAKHISIVSIILATLSAIAAIASLALQLAQLFG